LEEGWLGRWLGPSAFTRDCGGAIGGEAMIEVCKVTEALRRAGIKKRIVDGSGYGKLLLVLRLNAPYHYHF
jgi:hypothetical protein